MGQKLVELLDADEPALYLSEDKQSVLDRAGNVVAVAQDGPGTDKVYTEILPITDGRVCVRTESKTSKVCVSWNKQKVCVNWNTININVCVEWKDT